MPHGRTSTAAAQANAVMRRHPDCSEGRRLVFRSPHGHEQPVRTTDATGRGPQAPRSYGRYLVALYNEERHHQSHGYRTPRQVYEAQCRCICGRSALPTGSASPASRASSKSRQMLAFAHIPTGTATKKGFDIDAMNSRLIEPAVVLTAIGADIDTGRVTP